MKSLQKKITSMIVLVILVSTGILTLISYRRTRDSMSEQLESNYSVTAEKYAQELTAWINTNATIIDTMAAEITVSGVFADGYDAFHRYLAESYEMLNRRGYIYDIYFTFPDNSMACASDFIADGSVDYVHSRDWFTVAAETAELFYSTPYLDSDTGLPIITISRAVYAGGTLQGVLAADIFVDTLVNIISEADVAPDSYAFLVDRNLGMIVHPNAAYAFTDTPHGVMDIPDAPYTGVVEQIRSGSRETVYVNDYDGIERGIAISRMSNTGWYVGIATSKAELMRGVSGLMRGFLIAAVIAIVIGGMIAIVLSHVLEKLGKQQQEYEAQVLKLEKQAADEASQAKSRFLADMSHEIRTPINGILGMNEVILRETGSRDIREYALNIKQSGRYLLQLVNSILDFSKIEDGKMEIIPVSYRLSDQIACWINSVSEKARAKSLKLHLDIDPALPSGLYGDDMRIGQVVMNLLSNAVKYTEKGSVTLSIREKEWKSGTLSSSILLHFAVRDTGIGIRETDMRRLFESFERLDKVRNRGIEGTGLGLSITARLLSLMDSELKVESRYGEGSVFSFDLWQKIEDDRPLGAFRPSGAGADESFREALRAPEARILVVDDTQMNILVVVSLLKKTGIRIDTAAGGSEAVQLALENAYDLILMDQRMPEMDGAEAMQQIRGQAAGLNRETPVICLTADAVAGARDRYLSAGFTDYLPKPIDSHMLEQILLKYLPGEKILPAQGAAEEIPETAAQPEKDAGGRYAPLRRSGIRPDEGLCYCAGDSALYNSLLKEYACSAEEKMRDIALCYETKDWNRYGVLVHALKSTSRMIGASALSETAAGLEKAAGVPDTASLESGHSGMMEQYRHTVEAIQKIITQEEEPPAESDEIMEFDPE